jgi:hypothetical protein
VLEIKKQGQGYSSGTETARSACNFIKIKHSKTKNNSAMENRVVLNSNTGNFRFGKGISLLLHSDRRFFCEE